MRGGARRKKRSENGRREPRAASSVLCGRNVSDGEDGGSSETGRRRGRRAGGRGQRTAHDASRSPIPVLRFVRGA
ncbi:MAG: hypothetical protein QW379_02355 [Thermoplasmata archaeon]